MSLSTPLSTAHKRNKKRTQITIGLWLLFIVLCAVVVARAQFTADMSAFLPRNPTPTQQILIDQLNDGAASRSLILAVEGANANELAKLSQSFTPLLRSTNLFETVQNGQAQNVEADQALLFNYRYLLSPAVNAARMSPQGLRAAIEDSLLEVASSTGLFSKALLTSDPTGESLEVLKQVIPDLAMNQVDGVWVNQSQTRAMLLAQTKALGADLDAQEAAHAAINKAFSDAKTDTKIANAKLVFSGPGVFAVKSRDTIRSEAARLSTLGTLMVLGLLFLIYRSVAALFLGVLPVATGAIAGIAGVALGFSSVHAMTLGFGVTLIGEAVDYAIYLFVQHKNGPDDTDSFSTQFWPTIRLGVLTSVAGFVTLLFSGFTGLAQLGLFTIVGIVVAALVTRFVLPQLMPEQFTIRKPQQLGRWLETAVQGLQKLKWLVLLLLIAAGGYLITKPYGIWGTQLTDLSPVSLSMQKLDEQLRDDFGAAQPGSLVVIKAVDLETALQLSEQISTQLDVLVQKQLIRNYDSPSRFLPSNKTQLARQSVLPDAATLFASTTTALIGLPLKPDKLANFYADIVKAKIAPLLTLKDFDNTSLRLGLTALLSKSDSPKNPMPWTALIALRATETGTLDLGAIKNTLSLEPNSKGQLHVLDIKTEADTMYRDYFTEAKRLTASGLLAITCLLIFFLRSITRVARVLAPLVATVILVAAGIVFTHGSLSLLHLIGLLLVVAVGSNYALFFDYNPQQVTTNSSERHNMLSSLLFANLTTVVGFGLLAFSNVPVMNAIGVAVGSGAILALVLSAVFSNQATT
jgi:predicted exporter